jgi:hypothetical protein
LFANRFVANIIMSNTHPVGSFWEFVRPPLLRFAWNNPVSVWVYEKYESGTLTAAGGNVLRAAANLWNAPFTYHPSKHTNNHFVFDKLHKQTVCDNTAEFCGSEQNAFSEANVLHASMGNPLALFHYSSATEFVFMVALPISASMLVVHHVFQNIFTSIKWALKLTMMYVSALYLRAYIETLFVTKYI